MKGPMVWKDRLVQHSLAWSPRISIHRNFLCNTQKEPHCSPISPSYGKTLKHLGNPKNQTLLTRENPHSKGISIRYSPLYKHRISTFLKYTKTPQLFHYIILRVFLVYNLTFERFLASATPMPYAWSFHSCSIGIHWSNLEPTTH